MQILEPKKVPTNWEKPTLYYSLQVWNDENSMAYIDAYFQYASEAIANARHYMNTGARMANVREEIVYSRSENGEYSSSCPIWCSEYEFKKGETV